MTVAGKYCSIFSLGYDAPDGGLSCESNYMDLLSTVMGSLEVEWIIIVVIFTKSDGFSYFWEIPRFDSDPLWERLLNR